MKKVLSYICICVLLFSSTAYANDSEDIYNEVSEIAEALVTSDNVEELLGEAVILMIENDVLNRLTEKSEFTRAAALKASADEALDASANDAENAREKAISFCNNLKTAISVMTALETGSNYIINGDFSQTETLSENLVIQGSSANTTITKGTVIPTDWQIVDSSPHKNHSLSIACLDAPQAFFGTYNVPVIKGTGMGIQQTVKNLTPGQSYKLSLGLSGSVATYGVTLTVNFGKYDAATDTYTGLGSLADQSGLMNGQLLNQSTSGTIYTTKISRTLFVGPVANKDASLHDLNFVMPPEANAAVVTITGYGLASSNGVALDNIVLTEGKEVVNNGSFENFDGNNELKYDWYNGYAKTTSEATGNRYLKFPNASGKSDHRQYIVVKPGKVYKLSFKFAQNGFADGVSPYVQLTDYLNSKFTVYPSYDKAESSNLDWKTYEAYFTVPTNDEYALDMAVVGLVVGYSDTLPSGAAYCYDDISLQEADETVMGFTVAEEKGSFVTNAADAKTASCIYVQGATPAAAKFIVAKYNSSTHALENASVVNAGEGVAAGNAVRYDVELDDYSTASYYRIFLFDGTSLTPVLNSQRIG